MGFSLSYLAVNNKDKDAVLDLVRLKETGKKGMVDGRTTYCGTEMQNGWYLILSNDYNSPLLREALPKVSQDSTALFCQVEEHAMFSACKAFEKGSQVWAIVRDSDQDYENLAVSGELPDCYAAIEKDCRLQNSENACVDFLFEIPVMVFQSFANFRYDQWPEHLEDDGFDILAWIRPDYD